MSFPPPISHQLGLSELENVCPWLLMEGWPCSVRWDRVGRTTGGGGGPCAGVWAVSEQSFFFQEESVQSFSVWQTLVTLPGTVMATLGRDDSQNKTTDTHIS